MTTKTLTTAEHPLYRTVLSGIAAEDHPRRSPAISGSEPVLRGPQLAHVALFLAERAVAQYQSSVLHEIRQALAGGDVSKPPAAVPPLVAKWAQRQLVTAPAKALIVLASRALVASRHPRRRKVVIIREAVNNAVRLCHRQHPLAVRFLLQDLDDLLLSLEIAAAARQNFADRYPQVLYRAGGQRLDVAVVAFAESHGLLAPIGPLRRRSRPNGRRYLRWVEGTLDELLPLVPDRYFAAAVAAAMSDRSELSSGRAAA